MVNRYDDIFNILHQYFCSSESKSNPTGQFLLGTNSLVDGTTKKDDMENDTYWLFGPFRYILIQTVRFLSKLLASLMRNYSAKRSSGAPFFKQCQNYMMFPLFLYTPNFEMVNCLFAVAEG